MILPWTGEKVPRPRGEGAVAIKYVSADGSGGNDDNDDARGRGGAGRITARRRIKFETTVPVDGSVGKAYPLPSTPTTNEMSVLVNYETIAMVMSMFVIVLALVWGEMRRTGS